MSIKFTGNDYDMVWWTDQDADEDWIRDQQQADKQIFRDQCTSAIEVRRLDHVICKWWGQMLSDDLVDSERGSNCLWGAYMVSSGEIHEELGLLDSVRMELMIARLEK